MNAPPSPIQRKLLIVLVCGAVLVALLYQLASGWDAGAFLLRALGAAMVAALFAGLRLGA